MLFVLNDKKLWQFLDNILSEHVVVSFEAITSQTAVCYEAKKNKKTEN